MTGAGQIRDHSDERSICGLLGSVFDCSADLADHIRARGKLRNYGLRATLVHRGDRIATLFVVINGRAQAVLCSIDGQLVLLHEYRRGDCFGAMSPPYSATLDADIVAADPVSAFLLEGGVLAMLAEQHSCIALALLKVMVERLQRTSARMFEQVALSAVGRVHAELLRLAREFDDLTIRPAPVLADLALRLAAGHGDAFQERLGELRTAFATLPAATIAPHLDADLVIAGYADIEAAAVAARGLHDALHDRFPIQLAAHHGLIDCVSDPFSGAVRPTGSGVEIVRAIAGAAPPSTICVSDDFACVLAATTEIPRQVSRIGEIQALDGGSAIGLYALSRNPL